MIEAEELKANLVAIEEKEAQEKEDKAAATKAVEEEKKSLLLYTLLFVFLRCEAPVILYQGE